MTKKLSFEESLEADPLTPEQEQELQEQLEWDLTLEAVPTAAERNRGGRG